MPKLVHPDWPELTQAKGEVNHWDLPGAFGDLLYALNYEPARWVEPLSQETVEIDIWDIAKIARYSIYSHGEKVEPKEEPGSELQLYVVGELKDGRWFSVEAWNDYTGWDCQDGSDVRIGESEEHVVRFGLTSTARKELDYA
jgi:hypothetical protein